MKREELKQYDGKEGRPAYIAYQGKIYDATKSKFWSGGSHMGNHKAGEDLTASLSLAPHGEELLQRLELVGELEEDRPDYGSLDASGDKFFENKEKLRLLYKKYHPHPIMIHFPLGLYFFGALMEFLFLFTKNSTFEWAAFYALVVAAVTTFPAVFSGLFSWWINYESTLTHIFKVKLYFSMVLIATGTAVALMRFFVPDIAGRGDIVCLAYNALIFANFPIAALIAKYGGMITWPS